MSLMRLLYWNGQDPPEVLRELPPGAYVVELVESDEPPPISDDEDCGLRSALASLRAGQGRTVEQVQQAIETAIGSSRRER
jgi:hypothetical protein